MQYARHILCQLDMQQTDEGDVGVCQDEPTASAKWVEKYNERQKGVIQLESELMKRLGFTFNRSI